MKNLLNPYEAPSGYIAILKIDAYKYGKCGEFADKNICEFCDWRKDCQNPKVTKAIHNHRCMPHIIIVNNSKEEVSRKDECSVFFKKNNQQPIGDNYE